MKIPKLKVYIVCYGGLTKKETVNYMNDVAIDLYKSGISDIRVDKYKLRIDTPKCFIEFYSMNDIEAFKLKGRHVTEAFGFRDEVMKYHLRIDAPIYKGNMYEYISEIEGIEIKYFDN